MGLKIIKAVKISQESDINEYKNYDNADILLLYSVEKSIEFPKI